MTDEPRPRRTLSLKPGAAPKLPLEAPDIRKAAYVRPPAESKPKTDPRPKAGPIPVEIVHGWKCKPCGQSFDPPQEALDDTVVRCPACNAKIGVVGDFKQDPPPPRLRARSVKG